MKIIQAEPKDAKIILDFYNNIIDEMQSSPHKPRWIKNIYPSMEDIENHCINGELYFIGEKDIIASIVITNEKNISTIHLLATKPNFQNKGIAKYLLNFAKELCKKRGDLAIRLEALSDHISTNTLYKKCGYKLIDKKTYDFEFSGNIELNLYELSL